MKAAEGDITFAQPWSGRRCTRRQGFNPFPNKPWFLRVFKYIYLENTVGKGENARNEHFLLFPQRFLPVRRTCCHFH